MNAHGDFLKEQNIWSLKICDSIVSLVTFCIVSPFSYTHLMYAAATENWGQGTKMFIIYHERSVLEN